MGRASVVLILVSLCPLLRAGDLYFGENAVSWTQARDACKARGGWIVSPRTRGDLRRVNQRNWDSYWTGWNDRTIEGYWTDLIGNRLSPYSRMWLTGSVLPSSPDNAAEDCAVYRRSNHDIDDRSCGDPHPFICELDAKFYANEVSWHEAEARCRRIRGWLWAPRSQAEFQGSNVAGWTDFWTGWNDIQSEGDWRDGFGNRLGGSDLWPANQPDNANGVEHCGESMQLHYFNDIDCSQNQKYICKTGRYYYSSTAASWTDADNFCRQIGAHLFMPLSHDEIISVNIYNWGDFWMGYNDRNQEGSYFNSYNEQLHRGHPLWADGEPNDSGGNEDCVHLVGMHLGDGNRLNDQPCSEAKRFICAREYAHWG